ncbi:MAG: DUF1028 domain-containing protein [Asgard group archaeon]|nr:DUF1028 domain-containing protein [Asgard group archaeon]
MTFSIVAYDPENKEWGVAVQSKFVAVGTVVPFAKANVGAIATQANANTSYGPKGLAMLKAGLSAAEVIEVLTTNDPQKEERQVGVVDRDGNAASFTGSNCFDWAGHFIGKNFCCQGNILVSEETITAMASAYKETAGDLVEKLFAALEAGRDAGGDKRGKESAAILIVKEEGAYDGGTDRYVDIRVDEHPHPIKELRKVFDVYNLCLLKRDDPDDILKLESNVLETVLRVLKRDGFYDGSINQSYNKKIKNTLSKWFHTNNFEVKERDDDYIVGSVYRFMKKSLEK